MQGLTRYSGGVLFWRFTDFVELAIISVQKWISLLLSEYSVVRSYPIIKKENTKRNSIMFILMKLRILFLSSDIIKTGLKRCYSKENFISYTDN